MVFEKWSGFMFSLTFCEANSARCASVDVDVLSTAISSITGSHPWNHRTFRFGRDPKDP